MRVLAICKEDPAHILGGMGRHVRELYKAMACIPGVEIDLLTSGPGEGWSDYLGYRKRQSDKHVCFKPVFPGMSSYLIDDIQMTKAFAEMLAEGCQYDVIHAHEWGSVQVARIARQALKVPLVNTMHLCITHLSHMSSCPTDKVKELNEATRYLWQQEGNLVYDPDEFIVCSDAYVRIIREEFMTDRPINMIYNGIDTEVWHPNAGDGHRAKTEHRLPNRPIALFCGRIADMKGIRPLLDAIEFGDNGYCVVLVGDVNANTAAEREAWDVTRRIKSLIEQMPDRIRWLGFRHGQELHDLYAAADVGLMPSIHEPFGIVALEMMASGVPLISTEVDGLGEIVTNKSREYALIIPAGSSEHIRRALTMTKSREVRKELRDVGLERAKGFNWCGIAKQTIDVYQRARRKRCLYC